MIGDVFGLVGKEELLLLATTTKMLMSLIEVLILIFILMLMTRVTILCGEEVLQLLGGC